MSPITATIFKKIGDLEKQVQKLKIQAYFNLPKNKQTISLYPEETINRALKSTRKQIWQQKYANKIKRLP